MEKKKRSQFLFWLLFTTVVAVVNHHGGQAFLATGVVFGDIGTSPLYAVKAIFHVVDPTRDNVLGVLSIIVWTLLFKISCVYNLVLGADYKTEGGLTALMSLLDQYKKAIAGDKSKLRLVLVIGVLNTLLLVGFGLLCGDAGITAALSILSALEGVLTAIVNLKGAGADEPFKPYVLWTGMAIVLALYSIQRKGTGFVGIISGPVMTIHFVVIGILGGYWITQCPEILLSLSPHWGIKFVCTHSLLLTMEVMGSVMLCITGGEALYADLQHFGKTPIRLAWWGLVKWSLLLNYLGQGAYLLSGRQVFNEDVFFSMVPLCTFHGVPLGSLAMVALEALATVCASQALITGMSSLASAAAAAGQTFRMEIRHTSSHHKGQIYVPFVNWTLCSFTLAIMFWFKESKHLEAAYGLAVANVMLFTSLSMIIVAILDQRWRWKTMWAIAIFGTSACYDGVFIVSNSLKFVHGGWLPLTVALIVFITIQTWMWGRGQIKQAMNAFVRHDLAWLLGLKQQLTESGGCLRTVSEITVQGAGGPVVSRRVLELTESPRAFAYLVSRNIWQESDMIPPNLQGHLERHGTLPRQIIFFHVEELDVAKIVPGEARNEVKDFGNNVWSVVLKCGYTDEKDVEAALAELRRSQDIPDVEWQICVSEETLHTKPARGPKWYRAWMKFVVAMFQVQHEHSTKAHVYFGVKSGYVPTSLEVTLGDDNPRVTTRDFDQSQVSLPA